MKTVKFLVLTMAVSILMATTTIAATIEIYNTGVDSSGTALVGEVVDPHYTIAGFAVNPGDTFITPTDAYTLNSTSSFPFPHWIADSDLSRWVAPDGGNNVDDTTVPDGYYKYRTTFDLTGFDYTTAFISGRWSTDNEGWDILLNGISTGTLNRILDPTSFQAWHGFSVSGGFISGVNTLDFVVKNDIQATGNPSGLRVEITSATAAPVPEPGTMMLLGSGLVGLAGWGRKKFRK